ncbi:MAG TPA: DUF5309 family protein [Armatimonadota bacterium]|nr:DUF5309 family protein [Armatimonadota bacterium]
MANQTGVRTTSQYATETRNVRDVHDKIMLYDPTVAPLITLLNRVKRRKAVKSTHHEWFERDYCAVWTTANGAATAATTDVTLTVTDGTLFNAGTLFVAPKAATSSTAPELMRVTVVLGNVLTIVRDVGGAGVDTITSGDSLRIVGSAHEENGPLPTAMASAPSPKSTYLQIIRTVTNYSNTAIATNVYGAPGSDRDLQHYMDMVEHKKKLNSILLWGRSSQDLTGGISGYPIRTTMGLRSVIATNITDAGGMLTRKKFANFARSAFRYGEKDKILLCAPLIKQAITEWGVNFLKVSPGEDKFGVNITKVETAFGNFAMVNDWTLEDGVTGKNGFGSLAFSIDLDMITYLYLNNNGMNRDTKVELDVVKDGVDGKKDQIITEGGFRIMLENRHAMLYNVTDYMQ